MTEPAPNGTGKVTDATAQPETPPAARIAGIYARVSTEDQAKGYSLTTQIAGCRDLAQRAGYSVHESHVFTDEGISGAILERPGLLTLRELIRTNRIHALFCYDLDRLSRKVAHQLLIADECQEHGVSLRFITMPQNDNSAESHLMRIVTGGITEYERLKIIERSTRGLRGRAESGHVGGGQVALGYRPVREPHKGRWVIHPDEAQLVRRIYKMASEGMSCRAIAWQLSRECVKTRKDRTPGYGGQKLRPQGTWSQSTIHKILTYEGYHTGQVTFGGKSTPDGKIFIKVPVIIDPELYAAVQTQLRRNFLQAKRNRKHEYLLSGHLWCARCGKKMHGLDTGKVNPHRRYRCSSAWTLPPGERCDVSCKAERIEEDVWQAVERVLLQPEIIAAEVSRHQGTADVQLQDLAAQQRTLEGALQRCDRQEQRWHAAYAGEAIDLDEYKMRRAEVAATRQTLQAEREDVERQVEAIHLARGRVESLTSYCTRVWQQLATFSAEERRLALEALDVRATFDPDQPLRITGAIPLDDIMSTAGHRV
jgi:site-specific DNA recombinase